MPSINAPISLYGPLVDCLFCVSDHRRDSLRRAGKSVPPPVPPRALVDTGASCSCLDPALIKKLDIQPSGTTQVHTPSTQGVAHGCSIYDASLVIKGKDGDLSIGILPVVEVGLTYQGFDAILGRNVLQKCAMIYQGSAGIFSLYF